MFGVLLEKREKIAIGMADINLAITLRLPHLRVSIYAVGTILADLIIGSVTSEIRQI